MKTVLYLTRNGLLEPLGQSQIWGYVQGLAQTYRVVLITHEKPGDWDDRRRFEAQMRECYAHGVEWRPRRFFRSRTGLAAWWSMVRMSVDALRIEPDLIHARSYVPAYVATFASFLCRTPYVFDMRGFWLEELIESGRLRPGTIPHRLLLWAEVCALERAAAVVLLTEASRRHLAEKGLLTDTPVEVIPTCADIRRFSLQSDAVAPPEPAVGTIVFGCVGTVLSGWFDLEKLAAFFAAAAARYPDARFEVVTRDDADEVRKRIGGGEEVQSRLRVYASAPTDMPRVVASHDVSVVFYRSGAAQIARSPTRIGEALATGLPVVANDGIGDTGEILLSNRVGVLINSASQSEVLGGLERLDSLLRDPLLRSRCRATAECYFNLNNGQAKLKSLYRQALAARRR